MEESILPTLKALSESPDRGDPVLDEALARAKLSAYTQQNRRDQTVQILTAFIDHLPAGGKRVIVEFVAMSDRLYELAEHLRMAVLIPMKAHGGKTPPVTPSPLGIFARDDVEAESPDSCSGNDLKSLKAICLKRDHYQCVVTEIWDTSAQDKYDLGDVDKMGDTEIAHIIPYLWGSDEQAKEIAQCWETLYLLFPSLKDLISPTTINIPANAMTMLGPFHQDFGRLSLALEPTDQENTYKIKTYSGFQTWLTSYMPSPNKDNERLVKFEKHSDCELPSRVLLETHAAITEILHASGQAEQIDELLDKYEDIRYLAADGSTDLQRFLSLALIP